MWSRVLSTRSLTILSDPSIYIMDLWSNLCLHHSSSQSHQQILMCYRSCLHDHCSDHISNCPYSPHQSHSLLPLLHMGLSLCSRMPLHFHQHMNLKFKFVLNDHQHKVVFEISLLKGGNSKYEICQSQSCPVSIMFYIRHAEYE